ncbi:hypothetical protein [Streptomyces griseorubiginosus]|uniref:hypothetical protein n=1 Tax=Streptomyces griseorubiginosus TaxID=67304 RepID=UPI0036516C85
MDDDIDTYADVTIARLGDAMSTPDGEIIESGRRWMAGEVSDDEYFSKVARSAKAHPGHDWLDRVLSLVAAIFKTRST